VPIRDVRLQAAIVRGAELLLLHCRLPDGESFWLLPGGAREPGETPTAALAREVREELGVDVVVGDLVYDLPAEPPDGTYERWRTYRCALVAGNPCAQGVDGVATLDAVAWVPLDRADAWPDGVAEDRFLAPQLRRIHDQMIGTLRLSEHDPGWATRFAEEAERLRRAVGARAVAIEHVGSTSVPGLVAKPVIDVAIAVADERAADDCVAPLEALGYEYRGLHGDDPRRRYYVRAVDGRRFAQLHLYILPAAAWDAMLRFRDALRADPALRAAYAAEKQRVADVVGWDKGAYSIAKGPFIEAALDWIGAADA
jgi:GrpB-like predicted nucleotidyltransferase (UPF0157 family)/8-oxo-dGTP pyrophosphatase MutT (NUDIX family)